MSPQFDVEEFIRPLVSNIYESSEEDMEIGSLLVTENERNEDGADTDIQFIAWYREVQLYPIQLVAGRVMTTDFNTYVDESNQSTYGESGSIDFVVDPPDSLIDWFVGTPPQQTNALDHLDHQIANCSRIEPTRYSPMSPPLAEQDHRSVNIIVNGWTTKRGNYMG